MMAYGELLETEVEQDPETVPELLRSLADAIEGDEVTVEVGEESATVEAPTGDIEFEIELEREPAGDDVDEIELELELEWTVETGTAESSTPEAEASDDEEAETGELTIE